jgi:hypothetical protein
MFHIHILRVKCEGLPQGDFLREASNPITVITQSFEARPTADVGRNSEWHIGNVEVTRSGSISFAMGRTQAVKTPQFDETTHNFLEEEAMRAPFTLGVFDHETQACGIIRKSGVSQSTSEIAGKLSRLLNAAPFARQANSVIVVEPIPDPVNFIEAIRRSEAVTRFSFTVSKPNPQDVNRLIQGPAKEFTKEIGGVQTRVEVEGDSLDKDLIEDVTKAVAADGQNASASIRSQEGGPPRRISLSGNPVIERIEPRTC